MDISSSEIDNPNILYQLLVDWYGTIHFNRSLSSTQLMHQWATVWFAKGEQQKQVDVHLKTYECAINQFLNFKSNCLNEKVSMIILYDQVTRNIYRSTKNAYSYDDVARQIAFSIIETFSLSDLPIQYLLTIIICLIHSEKLDHLNLAQSLINRHLARNSMMDPRILESLNGIAKNHTDRILLFGRIPERNRWIGRESKPEELIYMRSIK